LIPFFKGTFTLQDYLKLDDSVLSTYFIQWMDMPDTILSDLAKRFLMRKPLKSAAFSDPEMTQTIDYLKSLIEKVGFNSKYYTAINSSYDLPYDFYRPEKNSHRTQIELWQKDGSLVELSKVSPLVAALAGQSQGDKRFYFPKEMLDQQDKNHYDLFEDTYHEFATYIHNGKLVAKNNV
jgi:HD superfamily phosphohydrolase